jgi:hypothetical protein
MPAKRYPDMTLEELMALFEEHGTWNAVGKHLDASRQTLDGIKKRLGASGKNRSAYRKPPNQFDPYFKTIEKLASQGANTHTILEAIGLPVTKNKKEQLRRFLHQHGLHVAPQGGPSGEQNGSWKGGRIVDKGGYILVKHPEHPDANVHGYVREHRLVMEGHLGRYLEKHEVVHHKNDNTSDNRIENLELFSSNAEHLSETLKGKVPNWTPEGTERIRKGIIEYWNQFREEKANSQASDDEATRS